MGNESKSFWSTLPGIITAVTGLITATVGGIVGLNQAGLIGSSKPESQIVQTDRGRDVDIAGGKLQDADKAELKKRQDDLEKKFEAIKQQQMVKGKTSNETQEAPQQVASSFVNIAGVWANDEGDTYMITQTGNELSLQETNPIYGVTAVGEGIIQGRQVTLSVTTALGTTGTLQMRLSGNNKLAGQYQDITTGITVPVSLTR